MIRLPHRVLLLLAAAVACFVSVPSAGSAEPTAPSGTQLWAHVYTGGTGRAVAFAGGKVFVTGASSATSGSEYATVAYDAASGNQLWVNRYRGPGALNGASCVTVSKDGATVFVSGSSYRTTSGNRDYATIAYDAASGQQLWLVRYDGPAHGYDEARAIALKSGAVFVTGTSRSSASKLDYATVAYNAATGAQLWASRYNGSGSGDDSASGLTLNKDGTKLVVTGTSDSVAGTQLNNDYATVAYDTATGQQLWARRYNGAGDGDDGARAVAIAGGKAFVTGGSWEQINEDYTTIAYDLTTGAQVWKSSWNELEEDYANAIVANADGTKLFVGGRPEIVAYNAATGAQLWDSGFYQGSDCSCAVALVLNGTGRLFATGAPYATVAYDISTGAYLWNAVDDQDAYAYASSIAVNSLGTRVFVTGFREQTYSSPPDYLTTAYQA